MKVFKGFQEIDDDALKVIGPDAAVTIGNFDGVHLGHQAILQQCRKDTGKNPVVYTFRPHPHMVLRADRKVPLLVTYDEKLSVLESLGIDAVIEQPFGREFSSLSAENFFSDVLIQKIGVRSIVVGYDFGFGKDRQGSLKLLQDLCQKSDVRLTIVKPHQVNGVVPSSSEIRKLLFESQIEKANALLGRAFSYQGVVVKGDSRGNQLGFPTANLKTHPIELDGKLILPSGVYHTNTQVDGKKFPSVTNIGVRPTFHNESKVLIETHLLDFKGDLYGETIEVQFAKKIREERKFSDVQELRTQIQKDIDHVRERI